MVSILIENDKVKGLTESIIYKNNQLTILNSFSDTIKVSLKNNDFADFNVVFNKNIDCKLIFEIYNESQEKKDLNIKVDIKENSRVKYLLILELNSADAKLEHTVNVYKDSDVNVLGGFVSNNLKTNFNINLNEEGSIANLRTITISSQDNDQELFCNLTHKAKNSIGDMTNVGIANKNGVVVLHGVGKIEKGMKNSSAFQTLKGIIMSDEARVDVNPILLIDEYDVKAGHAATVGHLEEEVLYYLRSRGLTKNEAEKLIINGLLQPIVSEIDDETLKSSFVDLVNMRI